MAVTAGEPGKGDDDLTGVLRHVALNTLAATRARTVNSQETREFLEIGLDLLRQDLLEHTGPDMDGAERSRLFESVSRERILKRAEQVDTNQTRLLSDTMFRRRWQHKNRYTEDLIAYLFRLDPQYRHLETMEAAAEQLVRTVSFGDLVRTLAAQEMQLTANDPLLALQSILQAALPRHPRVREFVTAQYELLLPRWAGLYERVALAYGLRIRTGLTWMDMALLFNAVIDGTLIRARIDGNAPALSDGSGVLSAAIMAMVPSLLDPPTSDVDQLFASPSGTRENTGM